MSFLIPPAPASGCSKLVNESFERAWSNSDDRIGGRLFVIRGDSPVMEALLINRVDQDEWTRRSLFETDLPRLRQG